MVGPLWTKSQMLPPETTRSVITFFDEMRARSIDATGLIGNVTLGYKGLDEILSRFKAEMGTPPFESYGPTLSQLYTKTEDWKDSLGGLTSALSQMAQIFTEDVGGISLHFQPSPIAVAAPLRGPGSGAPETNMWWNIPEWEIN